MGVVLKSITQCNVISKSYVLKPNQTKANELQLELAESEFGLYHRPHINNRTHISSGQKNIPRAQTGMDIITVPTLIELFYFQLSKVAHKDDLLLHLPVFITVNKTTQNVTQIQTID